MDRLCTNKCQDQNYPLIRSFIHTNKDTDIRVLRRTLKTSAHHLNVLALALYLSQRDPFKCKAILKSKRDKERERCDWLDRWALCEREGGNLFGIILN